MAAYDVRLTDNSVTTQNPNAATTFGGLRGGGMEFAFGGINDSPVSRHVWYAVIGAVALIGGLFLWRRKK